MSEERVMGFVDWFNSERGYGFLRKSDDPENRQYFVHFSFINMEGYKTLKSNQPVSFVITETDKGTQARDVIIEA